jgi:hypothetical protein
MNEDGKVLLGPFILLDCKLAADPSEKEFTIAMADRGLVCWGLNCALAVCPSNVSPSS